MEHCCKKLLLINFSYTSIMFYVLQRFAFENEIIASLQTYTQGYILSSKCVLGTSGC